MPGKENALPARGVGAEMFGKFELDQPSSNILPLSVVPDVRCNITFKDISGSRRHFPQVQQTTRPNLESIGDTNWTYFSHKPVPSSVRCIDYINRSEHWNHATRNQLDRVYVIRDPALYRIELIVVISEDALSKRVRSANQKYY